VKSIIILSPEMDKSIRKCPVLRIRSKNFTNSRSFLLAGYKANRKIGKFMYCTQRKVLIVCSVLIGTVQNELLVPSSS
jgi:hypothetical protein